MPAMCTERGLDEYVTFTGWLTEAECFSHLADADLGLDTNLQPEVTPVKGLEYMSFSVPMVAFDLHETRALAGPAARYVPPGDVGGMADAIAHLLDHPAEASRMSGAAMAALGDRFLETTLGRDIEETYLSVLARAGRYGAGGQRVRPELHRSC